MTQLTDNTFLNNGKCIDISFTKKFMDSIILVRRVGVTVCIVLAIPGQPMTTVYITPFMPDRETPSMSRVDNLYGIFLSHDANRRALYDMSADGVKTDDMGNGMTLTNVGIQAYVND